MFEQPLLLAALVIPALVALHIRRRSPGTVAFSSLAFLGSHERTLRERLHHAPDILRLVALGLLALALAGPVVTRTHQRVVGGGLDVMLLIDASRSMLAQDLAPNRLEAAKRIAEGLIAARPHDRFGLMTFAARGTVQCPLTTDRTALVTGLRQLATREHEEGTALGVAIAEALHQIRPTAREPAVIVLLTDGASNAGSIQPRTATAIAAATNVRIHAVGLGSTRPAPYPSEFGLLQVLLDMDEDVLRHVTSTTQGAYMSAETDRVADRLATELNLLDQHPAAVSVEHIRTNVAGHHLLATLVCLLLDLLLRATYLRTFP